MFNLTILRNDGLPPLNIPCATREAVQKAIDDAKTLPTYRDYSLMGVQSVQIAIEEIQTLPASPVAKG